MIKVMIRAKDLQRVRQAAKDEHTRNATAFISKGVLAFDVGNRVIELPEVKNEKH